MEKSRTMLSKRIVLVGVLVASVGCGERVYPVKGVITLDQKPLSDAGIAFHPVGVGPLGMAVSGSDGAFEVSSANKPGLRGGQYVVTVSKADGPAISSSDGLAPALAKRGRPAETSVVPAKYSMREQSPITITVPSDSYNLDLRR